MNGIQNKSSIPLYLSLSRKQWEIRFEFVVDEWMIVTITRDSILQLLFLPLTTQKGFHLAHSIIIPSMQLFLVYSNQKVVFHAFSSFEHIDLLAIYRRTVLVKNIIVKTVEVGIALSISCNGWRRMLKNSLRIWSHGEATKSKNLSGQFSCLLSLILEKRSFVK